MRRESSETLAAYLFNFAAIATQRNTLSPLSLVCSTLIPTVGIRRHLSQATVDRR